MTHNVGIDPRVAQERPELLERLDGRSRKSSKAAHTFAWASSLHQGRQTSFTGLLRPLSLPLDLH